MTRIPRWIYLNGALKFIHLDLLSLWQGCELDHTSCLKNKLTHTFLSFKAPAGMVQRPSCYLAHFYELIGVSISVTSEHLLHLRSLVQWRRLSRDSFFYVYLRNLRRYLSICEGELPLRISPFTSNMKLSDSILSINW